MSKVIKRFNIDFSDLPATSETRTFIISGDSDAEFKLEVKDKDTGKYYNFTTNTFETAIASLEEQLTNGEYKSFIKFPAVTGPDDQYDIYLWAKPGTRHTEYVEARFGDNSIDLNRSIGSNSLLMQKVIYQYAAITLTLQGFSPNSTIAADTLGTDTVTSLNSGKSKEKQSFSLAITAASNKVYKIIKQPTADDIISFVSPTVGAVGSIITLPGENEYPTARDAFTGDDIAGAITTGMVIDTDATDISANIAVGDKVTTPVTTDTVNGNFSSGATAITMDSAVATKMAVGDRVTGNAVLDAGFFLVDSLDSTNVFSLDAAAAIDDGTTLTFSSKVNRSLTTVTTFPVDESSFTISQTIQFRDNAPLTFWPRKNYQWYVNNYVNLIEYGMSVTGSAELESGTTINNYEDTVKIFENTEKEETIIKNSAPFSNTTGYTPTITKGRVTTQAGYIVFNKQQKYSLANQGLRVGGYGVGEALRLYGYNIELSNLKIELTPVTATVVNAVNTNTSVTVSSRIGILDGDTVTGIGIDSSSAVPTVSSGATSQTTQGAIVLSAAQTLESGATLTFAGSGRVATITGDIKVLKAGNANQTIRFDIEKLLTIH